MVSVGLGVLFYIADIPVDAVSEIPYFSSGNRSKNYRSTGEMREHTKAFCKLASETFECPGPVIEFGSYQVEGQLDLIDVRPFFKGREYIGCDMRPGPGVDRVEDVSAIKMPDGSAGTVLCIETFEHVFEVRKAFDEVFRVLKPGGMFLITSPLNFRIHAYPDDYWRMTPSCLHRLMLNYEGLVVGFQGYHKFPHSVMAIGFKSPIPATFAAQAQKFIASYESWLQATKNSRPFAIKLRENIGMLYRSKGERYQTSNYYTSDFTVELNGQRVVANSVAPKFRPDAIAG